MVSAGLYLGWAAIGKAVTGWDAFFWLSQKEVGSREAVTTYSLGFVLLAPLSKSRAHDSKECPLTHCAVYILMQGFVGVREGLTSLAHSEVAAEPEPLDE